MNNSMISFQNYGLVEENKFSGQPKQIKIDFYLWGYVKNEVYKIPVNTRDDMKNRIRDFFHNFYEMKYG